MGFFDKLTFWKKKDEFGDLGKDFGKDLGLDTNQSPSPDLGMGLEPLPSQQPFQKYPSFPPQQNFQAPNFQSPPSFQQAYPPASNDSYIASKNLEVISSKLDALKASIDSLNQRVANIEAIARGEQEDQRRKRYY